jgi:hypothetical protein
VGNKRRYFKLSLGELEGDRISWKRRLQLLRKRIAEGDGTEKRFARVEYEIALTEWSKFGYPDGADLGGNVIDDIDCIEKYGSEQYNEGKHWRNAFEHSYGVSLDDIRGEDVPKQFYHTLNGRASVINLPAWEYDTKRQEDRREIVRLCNEIIQAWKDKKADLFEEKSESLGWFKQAEKIWGRWGPF